MKKPYILPIILLVVFFAIDIGLLAVTEAYGVKFILVSIFLEVAVFGCIIIYLINKHKGDKDD